MEYQIIFNSKNIVSIQQQYLLLLKIGFKIYIGKPDDFLRLVSFGNSSSEI